MNTDEQTACTDSIVPSSLATNVHDLANSLNSISSTVQLLAEIILKETGSSQELISELLLIMNNECSRMESRLEALRRLAKRMDSAGSDAA
jgi:signal transduction histidine kinase